MSRIAWLAVVCGLMLTATPVFTNDPKPAQKADPVEKVFTALQKQKAEIDGAKLGELETFDVLKTVAKQLGVEIIVMEEAFKPKAFADFKDKQSFLKKLETKDLTLQQFLTVWLASLGATYEVHRDYIAIIPLVRANEKAQEPEKVDSTERLLTKLFDIEVQLKEGANVNEIPLFEILHFLSRQYNLSFVINEDAFKQLGVANIKEEKAAIAATQLRGVRLHRFLTLLLEGNGATFLITKGLIEIVPIKYAAKVTKSNISEGEGENGRVQLDEPLVSVIVKEKQLNEIVAKMAEDYDLNILVAPQAGGAKTLVTTRLLNVPADKALEQIALQADLRVVRTANTFLLTSKEHATELFNEKLDKERQKTALEKLRTPAKSPLAPVPAVPVPPEKPQEK